MTKKQVFPSWRYHKTEGSKIVYSKEESDWHEKKGWAETPAEFEPKEEKFEPKTSEASEQEDSTSDEEMKNLMEKAMEKGIPKKQLKGKSKAELQEIINGDK